MGGASTSQNYLRQVWFHRFRSLFTPIKVSEHKCIAAKDCEKKFCYVLGGIILEHIDNASGSSNCKKFPGKLFSDSLSDPRDIHIILDG